MALYVRAVDDREANLITEYSQSLRNVVRLRRFYGARIEAQAAKRTNADFAAKINLAYEPALRRVHDLEESVANLAGTLGFPDPLVLLPLYKKPSPGLIWPPDMVWPNLRGINPVVVPADEFALQMNPNTRLNGSVFEWRRYFLYKDHLWSAHQDNTYDDCVASVDKFLGPKELRSSVRRQSIPENVRIFVWRRDEGKCTNCGSQEKLEYDHIIALTNGGSNTARNIELLCEKCNRAKGAKVR